MEQLGYSLKVDEDSPIPINLQLKEQIKWLIGTGVFNPGDFLPSTTQLGKQLELNRNTVNWVYTQLRDEGLVSMQKGRGTQIVAGDEVDALIESRSILRPIIERIEAEVREQGLDFNDILAPAYAYVQLNEVNEPEVQRIQVQLIVGRETDYQFFKSEIEQRTGAEVTAFFLEDRHIDPMNELDTALEFDYIITTWAYKERVEHLYATAAVPVFTLAASAAMSTLLNIAQLAAGSKVAFIGSTDQVGEQMARYVTDAGIKGLISISRGLDSLDNLLAALEEADAVYTSEIVYERIKKISPENTNIFLMQLEKSSEDTLERMADAATKCTVNHMIG